MTAMQWVDEVPPVESPGHAGPRLIYFLFPESSPLDLEALTVGSVVTAELGSRTLTLTKVQTRGKTWLDPETNTRITAARAAQLGFRIAA